MTAPFDPERLAALARLSATINASAAPPPISVPVVIDGDGWVTLPVPGIAEDLTMVTAELHLGLTLQWAPMCAQGGALIDLRGGPPDGEVERDAVAVFLTRDGIRRLAKDLAAIVAALDAEMALA